MVADIVLMGLSLRDVENARKGLGELERKVDDACPWNSFHGSVGYISLRGRMPTTLERVSILLGQEMPSHVDNSRSSQLELKRVLPVEEQGPKVVVFDSKKATIAVKHKGSALSNQIYPDSVSVNAFLDIGAGLTFRLNFAGYDYSFQFTWLSSSPESGS
jgi:hypothetical protein